MKKLLVVFVFNLVVSYFYGQQVTEKDYERAVSFMRTNLNNKTVFNLHTTPNWFKDGSGLWFIDYTKDKKTYRTISFNTEKVEQLFDHTKLASLLSKNLDKEISLNEISLKSVERTAVGNLKIEVENKRFDLNLQTYELVEFAEGEAYKNPHESKSPDGKWIAFSRNYNLFLKSTETAEEFQLSTQGEKDYEYASGYGWFDIMEGENGKRPKRFYVNWSEDSKWINTSIVDTRTAEKMYLLDWSIDSLYKPKLLSYYRGSPGDTNMVKVTPVFYNVESKQEVKTNLPTGTHINAVNVRWSEKPGEIFASIRERGFLKQTIKALNLNNGDERILIEEKSNTGIDNFEYRVLGNRQKIIFLSERSGWRQLHILDLKTNQTSQLTSGDFYVNQLTYIDEENESIYFLGSGKNPENNPYHQQVYKVDFNGKETLLTPENTHHVVSFSSDGKYFVDNFSTIGVPTKTVLRSSINGKVIVELTTADATRAIAKGWQAPKPFSYIAKDGKTQLYGAYWRPTNFDANKFYPIIDATYTGPHTQRFPKSFNKGFDNQSLAELGFIVVQMDGLGTSGRSKEFHDHSYKNMGNNLEDHVLGIKYLANKHAWIDISQVGIFGHSAGGYDTGRALLAFPDFYKVGVASSADHDFRMEKAWWPEMYQGWPVDSTYHKVSNVTNAKNLKGKLLITHGGLDHNVNPSASFKLAEELIKADKQFDLLILPSQRHGYTGDHRLYFIKKRWNYFVEHLLGAEPIWDFKWN